MKTLPATPGIQVDDSDAARSLTFVKNTAAAVVVLATLQSSDGRAAATPSLLLTACPTFVALSAAQKLQFDNVLKGLFQDLVSAAGAT